MTSSPTTRSTASRRLPAAAIIAALLAALPTMASADEAAEAQRTAVERLGRLNGRALACGYGDLVARAREIVVAGAAKTREIGEAFEAGTQAAFLALGNNKEACPAREALTMEMTLAARPLAAAITTTRHQLADAREAPEVGINPRYLLQAANGRAIMDSDFRQQFQLITFGYTYCPDICPTTLLEVAEILKQLGTHADRVQGLFFSLDPERDSLAHLRTYTGFFHPRILGATGSPDLVRRAAENFKVRFAKVTDAANPGQYAVDHSAGLFLLAPGGQFLAKFPYGTPVAEITARLREEIEKRPPPAPASDKR